MCGVGHGTPSNIEHNFNRVKDKNPIKHFRVHISTLLSWQGLTEPSGIGMKLNYFHLLLYWHRPMFQSFQIKCIVRMQSIMITEMKLEMMEYGLWKIKKDVSNNWKMILLRMAHSCYVLSWHATCDLIE